MNAYQRTAIAAAIAACFPGLAGANVASVDFAVGNVTATSTDGRSRPLNKGSQIQVGETVATQNGRAQLRFADGAYMSLQPQTEFKVEQFQYSGKEDGKENIVMNLLKGGMRTITGLIGRTNRNNYKLRTEVATIGIRGTEYSVQYTNSIELFCAGGAVSIENQSGTFVVPSGQGVMVQNQNTAPQNTQGAPVLSPTSTTQQQQEEQQQADNEPTNPTQEADPPVTEEKAVAQLTTPAAPKILTGTFTAANWGASCAGSCFEQTAWINAMATLDSSGRATAFSNVPEGPFDIGTASATSDGNDGIIAWGRWMNGVTGGTNFVHGNRTLTASDPLHYVVGLPVTNMPTSGTATYSMIGSTPVSLSGLTSGTLNSSSLAVDFAASTLTMAINMTLNGTVYSTSAVNLQRAADRNGTASATGAFFGGFGFLAGGACGASLSVNGFLAGDAAARAGAAYRAFPIISGGTAAGVIAYQKN